jgi:hypothetical protein
MRADADAPWWRRWWVWAALALAAGRGLPARAPLTTTEHDGAGMWRNALYAVCIAEAAPLAAALVAAVVQPDVLGLAPPPRSASSADGAPWRS